VRDSTLSSRAWPGRRPISTTTAAFDLVVSQQQRGLRIFLQRKAGACEPLGRAAAAERKRDAYGARVEVVRAASHDLRACGRRKLSFRERSAHRGGARERAQHHGASPCTGRMEKPKHFRRRHWASTRRWCRARGPGSPVKPPQIAMVRFLPRAAKYGMLAVRSAPPRRLQRPEAGDHPAAESRSLGVRPSVRNGLTAAHAAFDKAAAGKTPPTWRLARPTAASR